MKLEVEVEVVVSWRFVAWFVEGRRDSGRRAAAEMLYRYFEITRI